MNLDPSTLPPELGGAAAALVALQAVAACVAFFAPAHTIAGRWARRVASLPLFPSALWGREASQK